MCTLSWIPTRQGFRLFFNRDERRTRARGRPPRINATPVGEFLGPVDGDFGGTWIGVSRFGLAGAILNRYEDTPVGAGLRRTRRARLTDYLPFTIAAVEPGRAVTLIDWNGRALTVSRTRRAGVLRTSSGADQDAADGARRLAYRQLAGSHLKPTPALLRRLHKSHLPRRGALSACMHRPEAKTQSFTELEVGVRYAAMWYAAGSPCRARLIRAGRITLHSRP